MATITVKESWGDYASLSAAVAAATTGDTIEISGTWSAPETNTISTTKNLTVTALGSAKHTGRIWQPGETHYRLRPTSGHVFTLTNTGTIIFNDVDIQNASTGVSDELFRNDVANTLIANRCLLGFALRNDQQDLLYTEKASDVTFNACHFYNVYRGVVDGYNHDAGLTVNINSCTGYNIGYSSAAGSRSGVVGTTGNNAATVRVFNSLFHIPTGNTCSADDVNSVTAHFERVITSSAQSSYYRGVILATDTNNTKSATVTDSTASAAYIVEDTAIPDLRIVDHANNTAQDNHTSATGAGLTVPTLDIVGTTRPENTSYDIGAFEVIDVAAAPVYVGPLAFVTAVEGAAYSYSVSPLFTGSVTSYTLESGSLAGSGISFNTSTGEFSGTPLNDTDVTGLSVSATNAIGTSSISNTDTLVIDPEVAALTAVGGDNDIDQFETVVALTHTFSNALTKCIINGVDHFDLISGGAGSETIDYIRRVSGSIEAVTCNITIGDDVEPDSTLEIIVNTLYPYSVPYSVVDSNSLCKSLEVTGSTGDACLKITTNPTNGTLTTEGTWLSVNIGSVYTPTSGYTGSDTIIFEVHDPDEATTPTQSFTATLTIS